MPCLPTAPCSYNAYRAPVDFLIETDAILDTLEYPDETGALATIPTGAASLLKSFKQFVAYQNSQNVAITKDYWTNITQAKFDAFRVANSIDIAHIYATALAPSAAVLPAFLAPPAALPPAFLAPPAAHAI